MHSAHVCSRILDSSDEWGLTLLTEISMPRELLFTYGTVGEMVVLEVHSRCPTL